MPGANCSFPECSVSRRRKYHGIAIFQIPRRKDDFHVNWRKALLDVLSRFRSIDKAFKNQMDTGKVYICECHFEPKDIELTSKFIFIRFASVLQR